MKKVFIVLFSIIGISLIFISSSNAATLPSTTIVGGKLDNFDASGLIINATNPMDLGDKVVKKFNNYGWSSDTVYLPVLPINQYYKFVGTNNGTNWTILFIDGYGNQLNYVNLFKGTSSGVILYNSDLSTLMSYSFATEGISGMVEIWVFESDDISSTEYTRGYSQGYRDGQLVSSGLDYEEGRYDGHTEGYDEGYDEGYELGHELGLDEGYNKGINDNIETGGFGLILASGFNAVGTIMAIELLPNVSIGALVAIPIVFGVIMFIIGRKKE